MRIFKSHPLLKLVNSYIIDSPQPSNLSYSWNFGSLLALCLVIQIITGVTLAMHYNPSVLEAFNSVEHIMRDVNNGWLIRYLHSNTASAFFLIVYLHIGRGLYYGSYKAPRTLVWTIGTVIFILMMATAFLGYVLPYGQMSLWGATVITNLMSAIPWVGQDIVEFIWGGFSVGDATLNRFFALHFVLPFVLAALALMHLITLHDSAGSGNPLGVSGSSDRLPFAPYFIFKDLITIFIFFLVLAIFVFFMPNVLGDSENYVMANPMQTPPAIVPEWYLLPFYAILRSIPNKLLGVIAMFSAILILLIMPFTDLSRSRGIQFSPISKIAYFIFISNFLILMQLGAEHVESPFIEFGQISTVLYFAHFLIIIPLISLFENSLSELDNYDSTNLKSSDVINSRTKSLDELQTESDNLEIKGSELPIRPTLLSGTGYGSGYGSGSGSGSGSGPAYGSGTGTGSGPASGSGSGYYSYNTPAGPVEEDIAASYEAARVKNAPAVDKAREAWEQARDLAKETRDYNSEGRATFGQDWPKSPLGKKTEAYVRHTQDQADKAWNDLSEAMYAPLKKQNQQFDEYNSDNNDSNDNNDNNDNNANKDNKDSKDNNDDDDGGDETYFDIQTPSNSRNKQVEYSTGPRQSRNLDTGMPAPRSCFVQSPLFIFSCVFLLIAALLCLLYAGITVFKLDVLNMFTMKTFKLEITNIFNCEMFKLDITDIFKCKTFNLDITNIFNCKTLHCDAPRPWGIYFQDSASPQMEALVELHDNILFYLVIILFGVGWMLISIVRNYKSIESPLSHKYLSHGTLVELIWTITPAVILILIAFPSFKLLYLMDEVSDPSMAVLAEGHQWYWSYQYPDFLTSDDEFIEFDSYLVPESDLENGALRMLEVDNRLIIPELTHVRFVVTGADVIHSYACPALGIKCDAYPGRLNQTSVMINREGTFYGQCSEICGILHSSMPIVIESVSIEKFVSWLLDA